MHFIRFCIHRPITTWMLMLLVVMLGALALNSMKVELLPDISVPTLVVVTKMTRAGADEVEEKVTVPLEDTLNALKHNRYEIDVPEDIRRRAAQSVERMIAIG